VPAHSLALSGDDAADELLSRDPLALLIGMVLDQQVPLEWAFRSPLELRERLGGRLDPAEMAAMDPEDLVKVFTGPPALHRFPGSMAKRVQALSQHLVDTYDGVTEHLWTEARTGDELFRRLRELPGFGEEKARIFVALLAKRFGVRPRGWKPAAGPFADNQRRSVADISSRAEFEKVRAWKKAQKAKGLGKSD
jgi:uncharacterized HhH-GPD family protein